jgi:4-hydroxy-2,2'-bipyrrole-5-carbaldehyde O-methyltransferase
MIRPSRVKVRGVVDSVRTGHASARALAVTDSRSFVRSIFLSSAIRSGVLDLLRQARSFDEVAAHLDAVRTDRLQSWLDVGCALGELAQRRGRYGLRGRRARAIGAGDVLLRAHYRSMLDYQLGPYAELLTLLTDGPSDGRSDLSDYADDIAQVSLAATPFISAYLTSVLSERRADRVLDVGCGTAIYSKIAAGVDPLLHVDGIDLAAEVIAAAQTELRASGLDDRIRLHVGDVREWKPPSAQRYDLILLLNNIYYFPPEERVSLYRQLRDLLNDGGELIVATLTATGSIAATHLNFMLVSQSGDAGLPRAGELESDLAEAGLRIVDTAHIVPTEPFVAVRARAV